MKCHYCGAEVAENQSFCMWCGTRQERTAEPVMEVKEESFVKEEIPVAEEIAQEEPAQEVAAPKQPAPIQVEIVKTEPVRVMGKYLPRLELPTGRGLGKMIFLGILTLGIYPVVIWSRIVTELNIAASRHDGRRTMPFFGMTMLAAVTLGIYPLVWMHNFCGRIGEELKRRGIGYQFGPSAFWLWNVLGSLILVGPFIFVHKLMKAMNKINGDFNVNG